MKTNSVGRFMVCVIELSRLVLGAENFKCYGVEVKQEKRSGVIFSFRIVYIVYNKDMGQCHRISIIGVPLSI